MSQPEPTVAQSLPADPMSVLGEAATGMHELYSSFVASGFTESQAMQLIVAGWVEQLRFHLGQATS